MPASDAVHAVQKAISSAQLCSLGSSASADRHDALADITNKRVTLGLAKADQYVTIVAVRCTFAIHLSQPVLVHVRP